MQKIYIPMYVHFCMESQFLLDEIGLEVSRSQKSNRKSGGETKKSKSLMFINPSLRPFKIHI